MTASSINTLKKKPTSSRAIFGSVMTTVSAFCLCATLLPLGAVLYFVLVQGFSRLNLNLFTQLPPPPGLQEGGLANAILGTLIVVTIATLIAVRSVFLRQFICLSLAEAINLPLLFVLPPTF